MMRRPRTYHHCSTLKATWTCSSSCSWHSYHSNSIKSQHQVETKMTLWASICTSIICTRRWGSNIIILSYHWEMSKSLWDRNLLLIWCSRWTSSVVFRTTLRNLEPAASWMSPLKRQKHRTGSYLGLDPRCLLEQRLIFMTSRMRLTSITSTWKSIFPKRILPVRALAQLDKKMSQRSGRESTAITSTCFLPRHCTRKLEISTALITIWMLGQEW